MRKSIWMGLCGFMAFALGLTRGIEAVIFALEIQNEVIEAGIVDTYFMASGAYVLNGA